MTGTCKECIEKQKTVKDYCCVLCSLGFTKGSDHVISDPFTGTTYVDLSDPNHPFWGPRGFYGNKK